jgi:hypothetical protein
MAVDQCTDDIAIGVLKEAVPCEVVDEGPAGTGRREKRSRLLPAHVMATTATSRSVTGFAAAAVPGRANGQA